MARKSYNRCFRKNGHSFRVTPVYKQDKRSPKDRLVLEVKKDGFYQCVYDYGYRNTLHFETIREAQEHAWSLGHEIPTLW